MRLRADGGTDRGLVRPRNEDALLVAAERGLFVVCDGIGGRPGGEVASATGVEVIDAVVRAGLPALADAAIDAIDGALARLLEAAFARANEALFRVAVDEPALAGLGTTASALLIARDHAVIAHVGDSRIYQIRGREVRQLTVDHTLAELARQRGVDPEKAARYGGITKGLGLRDPVIVDSVAVDLRIGDRLLLCSDGLHAHLGDDGVIADLVAGAIEGVVPRALALAREGGGQDNITAVIVACEG